ncbi:FAD-dependent monooxygenase [Corallococcus exercitus]|uniref:2,4-dichlorophenol 6-monooxygenase n=1 Tax=Corallococcus exercitus TaxID=2316736 RepID=A0A7Y4JP28_9BACT|nr:FAD-dependent monooxygenase [Corallococcus exercitus]NOK07682.1 2,4-dichlorophenol 6-monooxygenase [Corallococcus exercitus]
METKSTAVLVVGGSLVGLSAAVFLAWRGVPTVVVERHPGSHPHPRAIGFTPRTLELLRAVGLGARIPQAPPGMRLRRVRAESLSGQWFEESAWTPEDRNVPDLEFSPCRGAAMAQDRLEPILREQALALGADLRLGTELVRFEQSADGVVAWLRGRDGQEELLRADYLVAADGHRSPVREALGIGRSGRGLMRTARSAIFRAPLQEYLKAGVSQFNIVQPGFEAFLTTYGDGRWLLIHREDRELDDAELRALIARAIGRDDVPVEVLTTGRWEISALIADRFASGRVFLAGDSAHTLPPNRGGYGANTGIDDAHNLAWKLAAVHSGAASPRLLDTYDAERRPIAWLRHQQIFARDDFKPMAAPGSDAPILDDAAMEFGQLYRSDAVLGADATLPPAARPDQWAGQPGTRAPHLWVEKGGERVSTLDLLQRTWVLLTEDARWESAVARVARASGLALECVRMGGDVRPLDAEAFRSAFGLKAGGASLIRPDGYVAWRSVDLPDSPFDALRESLAKCASATRMG